MSTFVVVVVVVATPAAAAVEVVVALFLLPEALVTAFRLCCFLQPVRRAATKTKSSFPLIRIRHGR